MTEEQFIGFIGETIPQQLFHVSPRDIDDETGVKLDEVILIGLINDNITCLKHKPLQWFLDTYLISIEDWDKMNSVPSTEEELFHNILEDERKTENTVDNSWMTIMKKIKSWDDGGCSTGLNED